MNSNIFNLVSEEVFSDKLDALTEAIRTLNNGGSSDPTVPDPPIQPDDPEIVYDTKGLEYKTRLIQIDSNPDTSYSWTFCFTLNNTHFILSTYDKVVATSTDGDNWKVEPIVADFEFPYIYGYGIRPLLSENDVIVFAQGSDIYRTLDGYTWSKISDALPIASSTATNNLIFFNDQYISITEDPIIYTDSGYGIYCHTSSDALNWERKLIHLKWTLIDPGEDGIEGSLSSRKAIAITCINGKLFITIADTGLFEVNPDLSSATFLSDTILEIVSYFDNNYLALKYLPDRYYNASYTVYSSHDLVEWISQGLMFYGSEPTVIHNSKCIIIAGNVGESGSISVRMLGDHSWMHTSNLWGEICSFNDIFIKLSDFVEVSDDGITWLSGYIEWLEQKEVDVTKNIQNLLLRDNQALNLSAYAITDEIAPPCRNFCWGDVLSETASHVHRLVALNTTASYNPFYSTREFYIAYSDDDGKTWKKSNIDNITSFLPYASGGEFSSISGWCNICFTGHEFILLQKTTSSDGNGLGINQCLAQSTDGITWNIVTVLPDEFSTIIWKSICAIDSGIIAISDTAGCLITYNNGTDTSHGVSISSIEFDRELKLEKIITLGGPNAYRVHEYALAFGDNMAVFIDKDGHVHKYMEFPTGNFIDAISDDYDVYAINSSGIVARCYVEAESDYLYTSSEWELLASPLEQASSITWIECPEYDENEELYMTKRPCVVSPTAFYVFGYWGSTIIHSNIPDSDRYDVFDPDSAYIYQGQDYTIYYYRYSESYGSIRRIYASTDYGKTWTSHISNLIQTGKRVTEDVANTLWPALTENISNKIREMTSSNLQIETLSPLIERDISTFFKDCLGTLVYNKKLDRFAISKDLTTVWYSDDNMSTWNEFKHSTDGLVVAAIDNAFIIKAQKYANDILIDQQFYASTLEQSSTVISCRSYNNELPVAEYSFSLGSYEENDRLLMYGNNVLAYSTNGVEWYVVLDTFPLSHAAEVSYLNGRWVAIDVPQDYSYDPKGLSIYYSDDSINWVTSQMHACIHKYNNLYEEIPYACSVSTSDTQWFLQVGYRFYPEWVEGGPDYNVAVFKSIDGDVWEEFTARDSEAANLGSKFPTHFINGRFIDISQHLYSYDGVEWFKDENLPQLPSSESFTAHNSTIYSSDSFILIECYLSYNQNSNDRYRTVFYKSVDGYTWSPCAIPTIIHLNNNARNIIPTLATAIYSNIINNKTIRISPTDWIDKKCIYSGLPMITKQTILFITPNSVSYEDYMRSQVECIDQNSGSLTFSYFGNTPTRDIFIDLLLLQPSASDGIGSNIQLYNPNDY